MNIDFKIYVVGGFVRDTLLGRTPKDADFVVVGATVNDLMEFGRQNGIKFRKVGSNFPVYLDDGGREWAFARKEKKTGPGYHGFNVEFNPNITLEEDLFRRDLTMNAMAMEVEGMDARDGTFGTNPKIIDPFGGHKDIRHKVLRHVSDHFAEDPIRVLRVARFASRYNFEVCESTLHLIQTMCENGELNHLVSERVWLELYKVLDVESETQSVLTFFDVLKQTVACKILFPSIANTTFSNAFRRAIDATNSVESKIALLAAGMTHEDAQHFCTKEAKMPRDWETFAIKFNILLSVATLFSLNEKIKVEQVMELFKTCEVYRDSDFLQKALDTATYMRKFKLIGAIVIIKELYDATKTIGFDNLNSTQQSSLTGPKIQQAIDNIRKEVVYKKLVIKRFIW
jgi:tRNA nucleotidyltransferase (CCA-adding enzyme)